MKKIDDKFSNQREKLRGELRKINMKDFTIEKFMKDDDIYFCDRCNTPNMFPLHINLKQRYIMYECSNCQYTYIIDMDKNEK